ncbi:hypothetical protein DSO57_1002702 [Entomophthora muscae]|uniref:Uncharacterized protein n=1 Tax=Entomophthora muscae TaxID=34485 RepID=A0ACC2UJA7_9FUNG|nr:hypothetical protein DSO57_1002702 [Entomophthora muscae]
MSDSFVDLTSDSEDFQPARYDFQSTTKKTKAGNKRLPDFFSHKGMSQASLSPNVAGTRHGKSILDPIPTCKVPAGALSLAGAQFSDKSTILNETSSIQQPCISEQSSLLALGANNSSKPSSTECSTNTTSSIQPILFTIKAPVEVQLNMAASAKRIAPMSNPLMVSSTDDKSNPFNGVDKIIPNPNILGSPATLPQWLLRNQASVTRILQPNFNTREAQRNNELNPTHVVSPNDKLSKQTCQPSKKNPQESRTLAFEQIDEASSDSSATENPPKKPKPDVAGSKSKELSNFQPLFIQLESTSIPKQKISACKDKTLISIDSSTQPNHQIKYNFDDLYRYPEPSNSRNVPKPPKKITLDAEVNPFPPCEEDFSVDMDIPLDLFQTDLSPHHFQADLDSLKTTASQTPNIPYAASLSYSDASDDGHEVRLVLAKRTLKRSVFYLVRWASGSQDTWIPKIQIQGGELIEAFEAMICDNRLVSSWTSVDVNGVTITLPPHIVQFVELLSRDKGPVISVFNDVDTSGPPLNFAYINSSICGEGVVQPETLAAGCNCTGACHPNKECSCFEHQTNHSYFPTYTSRRLKLTDNFGIFECNSRCSCSKTCGNRVVQQGRKVKIQLFKTSLKGWGVRALQNIKQGTFIMEYVGEIITTDEAERRGRVYDALQTTYLFDLDFEHGQEEDCYYTIDAAYFGNASHFFNHSCDPNMAIRSVFIDSHSKDLHHLAFFAIKHIEAFEELTFDYLPNPPKDSSNLAQACPKQYACKCGASNCRGYFHQV